MKITWKVLDPWKVGQLYGNRDLLKMIICYQYNHVFVNPIMNLTPVEVDLRSPRVEIVYSVM